MRKNKKAKQKEREQATMENLGVPRLLKPSLFHMEMQGNEEVILDGCDGVLDYGETAIKIRAGKLLITFQGDGLLLKSYRDSEAVIEGQILNIAFEN